MINPKKYMMAGFTLVELLTTIIIIGVLAGIAWPSYSRYVEKGDLAEAKTILITVNQEILNQKVAQLGDVNNTGLSKDDIETKYIQPKISSIQQSSSVPPKYTIGIACDNDEACSSNYHLYAKPERSGYRKNLWMNDLGEAYTCTDTDTIAASISTIKNSDKCERG
ncbi:PilX family type IV pilin [Neisseriaceae bacterium ESL0693]|nr:PilX family type IV pilin [Neisseriaceae bacterium ESL0693]